MLFRSVDVRRAARLRGARPRLRGLRPTVIPVLEGTMDRSLALAAAMEARGYGSRSAVETARGPAPWVQPTCVLGAVACVALAAYGLFDSAWPGWAPVALTAMAVLALVAASRVDRSARRTVYRPQPWTVASSAVVASATVCAGLLVLVVPVAIRQPAMVQAGGARGITLLALLPDLTVLALAAPLAAAAPALLPLVVRWRRS